MQENDYIERRAMDRKVIFLDIDGTLTEPGKNQPPQSALWAIREARERGHRVFLCSGRNYGMLSPLLAYPFDGVIASSGGCILCGDQVIYDRPVSKAVQARAEQLLRKKGIFYTIECRDNSYTDPGFKAFLREHVEEGANSELLRWREQLEQSLNILSLEEYQGQPVYKIVVMSPSPERLKELGKELEKDFSLCIQEPDRYGFVNGELVSREYDKGRGVARVCRHLGVSVRDTIAFGDSMNDLEMIREAGLGICMENGCRQLKELADEICPPVTEDGIYRAFARLGLIGRPEAVNDPKEGGFSGKRTVRADGGRGAQE